MKRNKKYELVTLLFVLIAIIILTIVHKTSNVNLSLAIQTILILYLIRVSYGCILYIKYQFQKQKYSYGLVMNLGLLMFLVVNILRQINLLIIDFNTSNIIDIYMNTLNSFEFLSFLTLPCIIVISIYSIITNFVLIRKEGFKSHNLLGIIFGFLALASVFVNQAIYSFTSTLDLSIFELSIKKFCDISINAVLAYFYCLILATLYCNIMAGIHKPKFDKDYIIILGCKVRKDGTLTPLLKSRVDKAIEFAKEQKKNTNKDIVYIPSGGKGSDETIAEAEAIKNYLLKNGIKKKNIIIEDKSVNTRENMRFSKEKIDKLNKEGKIVFSTTNYHVFRSGVIANSEGIDCEGIGSTTKWYFYTNALIREFVANLVNQRKQHFVLIISIVISLFILILIGYHNKLITNFIVNLF